jgi:hypothetical protein
MSEETEIRAALALNAAFYRALGEGDVAAMDSLWATAGPVICGHPGAPPLHGRDAVMGSWRQMLRSPPRISATGAQVAMVRGLAFITCTEVIGETRLAATNILIWEGGAWRMAFHQAGQLAEDVPEASAGAGALH